MLAVGLFVVACSDDEDTSVTYKWAKTYGGTNNDGANSIQQTTDGGYIVAGWTKSYGAGDGDIWVLKLDSE